MSKIHTFEDVTYEIYKLSSKDILFDAYVQLKCQNCVNYGSTYHCPPNTPKFYKAESILTRYSNHYLITMKDDRTTWIEKIKNKHPSYTYKRLVNLASRNWDATSYWKFHRLMTFLHNHWENTTHKPVLTLGSGGGCRLCRPCNIHKNMACKKPQQSMPSPESWGIDVYGTLLNLGIDIEIPPRNIFTRVGFLCAMEAIPKVEVNHLQIQRNSHLSEMISNFSRIVQSLNEIAEVNVVSINPLKNVELNFDACVNCQHNTSFLCDRSFLPISHIQEFLHTKICITLDIKYDSNYSKSLSLAEDTIHRFSFYDVIKFSNHPCDDCDDCNSKGCNLTNTKRNTKFGRKNAYRCIRYLGLNPLDFGGNNDESLRRSYLVFSNNEYN